MIKNYFKTAFRSLIKNRSYSFLNIFGLAIGIACAALIFLWVESELTYNNYFPNKTSLYKVKDRQTYNGITYAFDATPGPLAAGMKNEIPGFRAVARSTFNYNLLFTLGDKTIYELGNYVDPAFLSMFRLQFVKGTAANAFSQLNSLVITETMANKFFDSDDVIGKTLKVDNNKDFVITGVIKDLPKNVSLKFDWLAPFKVYENDNSWLSQWGSNSLITFAEVAPNVDVNAINKKLYGYVQTKQQGATARMSVYPMTRWRLYDSFDTNGIEKEGRLKYVNLFTLIAWIVLIIACINFMNLSTARSERRSREVGVRKVMGAGRWKLIAQFIGESLFLSFVSGIIALIIIALLLPSFNTLVQKQLTLDLFNPLHAGALLMIVLVCGLIAGSYPAFYLSSFKPISVLKGLNLKNSGSAVFIRKGLVVMQFAISVILIICTVIIYKQVRYAKDRDIGYDKQGLVYLHLRGQMAQHLDAIKNELATTGMVQNAGASSQTVLQLGSNTGDFNWPGKDPNKQLLVSIDNVSPGFISAIGAHLKEGRDFYPNAVADSNNVIINEAFAKTIKARHIIGTEISRSGNQKFTVVGVIHDFVYNNMYASAAPVVMFCDPKNTYYLNIRLKTGIDTKTALQPIEGVIKKANPGYPVEFNFVDLEFEDFFKAETLIGKLSGIFAGLAIMISCLGLFGLTAYTAERRVKEIGIRKVLGATSRGLATLLSKDFVLLVIISCVIAYPLSWWIMNAWLKDYEYKTEINWWIFIATDLLAIAIAIGTISFQAVKAALTNPVESLRSE